jgi:hypothetical protein
MWTIDPGPEYARRHKRLEKKRPREVAAVLDNLDTIMNGLNGGLKLEQVRLAGFIHAEPHGVWAIDQKGSPHGKLAQTRLYVYANPKTCVVHLITLGDKQSQTEDIKTSSNFVMQLREEEEKAQEEKRGSDDQEDTLHRGIPDD